VSNKPLIKMTFRRGETTHSVLSVWRGKFPGTYSISRDKGTDKYPPISIVDVIKAFAAGEGFVNVSVESEREQRGSSSQRGGDYSDAKDPMGDSEIPF
jgi:hypothetical protein